MLRVWIEAFGRAGTSASFNVSVQSIHILLMAYGLDLPLVGIIVELMMLQALVIEPTILLPTMSAAGDTVLPAAFAAFAAFIPAPDLLTVLASVSTFARRSADKLYQ